MKKAGEMFNGHKGVAKDEGKMTRNGTPMTIDPPGMSDGGGSTDVCKAAKSINVGNRKGGLPGL